MLTPSTLVLSVSPGWRKVKQRYFNWLGLTSTYSLTRAIWRAYADGAGLTATGPTPVGRRGASDGFRDRAQADRGGRANRRRPPYIDLRCRGGGAQGYVRGSGPAEGRARSPVPQVPAGGRPER